ncbi:MAG: hypothetical protein VW452_01670 [Pelagibacteraceae bacterium]
MAQNTLEHRLMALQQALSQMMRNSSEKDIVEQLATYRIAIQTTLKLLNKKQKNTICKSESELEDELERGIF